MMTTLENSRLTQHKLDLSDREFQLIASLIDNTFGIHLEKNKKSLVISRLRNLILKKGFLSFREYYDFISADSTGIELLTLVDKISTNHSFFFREIEHFNLLKQIIPRLLRLPSVRSSGQLKFWSAGCAAGEEPYTLAMILSEMKDTVLKGVDVKILATDISRSVLEDAGRGKYALEKLRLVPKYYLTRYFEPAGEDVFAVKDSLKSMILFKSLNLMRDRYPFKGKFDLILCRNVMIYFTGDTRETLVQKFIASLNRGGYLFIGHSETLGRNHPELNYIEPAVYRYG